MGAAFAGVFCGVLNEPLVEDILKTRPIAGCFV